MAELPEWLIAAGMAAYLGLVLLAVIVAIVSKHWTFLQSVLWVLVILAVPLVGSVLFLILDARAGGEALAAQRTG